VKFVLSTLTETKVYDKPWQIDRHDVLHCIAI